MTEIILSRNGQANAGATDAKAKMFLRIRNTSVHRCELIGSNVFLTRFGATPHLDLPERHSARTYL
jgi:hypothetical protein